MEKLHFCRKLRPALLHLASQQCRLSVNVLALKIHMSEEAYSALMTFPDFITECRGDIPVKVENLVLVHGQVTIIFVVSVCLSVCLFVCAEFFSAVFDPISIKLGHI